MVLSLFIIDIFISTVIAFYYLVFSFCFHFIPIQISHNINFIWFHIFCLFDETMETFSLKGEWLTSLEAMYKILLKKENWNLFLFKPLLVLSTQKNVNFDWYVMMLGWNTLKDFWLKSSVGLICTPFGKSFNPLSARILTDFGLLDKRLLEGRVLHKGAWVAALLGTLLGVQDYKKVKFPLRDNWSLAGKVTLRLSYRFPLRRYDTKETPLIYFVVIYLL